MYRSGMQRKFFLSLHFVYKLGYNLTIQLLCCRTRHNGRELLKELIFGKLTLRYLLGLHTVLLHLDRLAS